MTSAAVDLTDVYVRRGVVSATRSVRDIDTNSRRRFLYHVPLAAGPVPFVAPPAELPAKVKARIPSPSGKKLAVLVEESLPANGSAAAFKGTRLAFEIWTDDGQRLARRIVLPPDTHGAVCTDVAWFGGMGWSPDETALVYTAAVNSPKTRSFFDAAKEDEVAAVGGRYTLGAGKSEDWGEKYGTTALLSLFCLDVETGKVGAVENVPGGGVARDTSEGGYVLGQPVFSPCGKTVVYTGWDAGGGGEMPRRLGAIYCFHRPCKLYASPVGELLRRLADPAEDGDGTAAKKRRREDPGAEEPGTATAQDAPFACVTPDDRLARSPRFSQAGGDAAQLAYLGNAAGFATHGGCMALRVAAWDPATGALAPGSTRTVVDVVRVPGDRGDSTEVAGIKFPGLFLNQLPDDCFSPDGKYLVTTTEWGSVHKVVKISLADGAVTPVGFDLQSDEGWHRTASQRFVCFAEGGAVVTQSEAHRPTVLGYLPPSFLEHGREVAVSRVLASLPPIAATAFSSTWPAASFTPGEGYTYQISNVQPEHGEVKVPVGSVLLLPDNAGKEKPPLIVVPHGGPHTCMSTAYVPSYGYLCQHGGYAVLHVNFRGSTGFGQAALESLAGTAGSQDVLDVVAATRAAIAAGVVDPDRVGICGGSHGGFLAGHCIGQHPELFKVATMRNPCTNIASMVTATDIPDWCYVETLGPSRYDFSDFREPSKEELGAMWDRSPVAHLGRATAPTLIALGMRDRRVPPSQGLEYYHALRARGVPTRLLVYEDCDHAIDLVASEADHWINAKRWFDRHL